MFRKINENEKPDVLSYGNITGKFIIEPKAFSKIITSDVNIKRYCFIPFKTEYYSLIWDFDYKVDKYSDLLNGLIDSFDKITMDIIQKIIEVIKETFTCDDNTTDYIYAIKNIGYGVHIYFPNIIFRIDWSHYDC